MPEPPAFLSFPDLQQASDQAGPSKNAGSSFSSFPDIDLAPKRERDAGTHRESSPYDDKTRSRDDRKRRSDSRERERRRRDRERDRHESRRHDRDQRHESRRSRSRSRERHERDREERRDRDERRKEKEERHDKERKRAREREDADRFARADDSGAWYEGAKPRVEPTTSKSYFADTVGDRDVIRYGASSSVSAPRYRREARGKILGLSSGLRIVYSRDRTEKGVEVAPLGRPYNPRYSSRPLQASQRRILVRPQGDDELQDFIAFDNELRHEQEDDDDTPDYRAISIGEAPVDVVPDATDDLKQRRLAFEQHLAAHPDDIDEWIKYSTLHLQLFPEPSSSAFVDPAKQPSTRANAEVTLSMLARALDAHPSNFVSPTLHSAYLRAAEAFWPSAKVTERWQNVIRELSDRNVPDEDMVGLYLGYIEWREGQGFGSGAGGVDEVVQVYIECLNKLTAGTLATDYAAREENQVYLFLRACLFLQQTGFTERALAAFQALMEMTFYKPDHLRPPLPPFDRQAWFEGVTMEFEDFWDSEAPRVGEPGAQGWKATHASLEQAPMPRTDVLDDQALTSADPYTRWYAAERYAETAIALPGRATDLDAPEDDPFHVVLFGDISPLLFPVQTPLARLQLIYAFFNFLGLPFTPPDVPTSSPSSTDPHLLWSISQNVTLRRAFWPTRPDTKRIAWATVGGEPMEPEQPRTLASPFACPVKSWMSERDTLFASQWFRDLDAADLSHVNVDVARNVLTMLRPLVPDPSFVLATFAFEAALSSKAAVKVAKTVLSTDRDNLALWDGYARLELQRGKAAVARQVYATAIASATERAAAGADIDLQQDEKELWAAWAEMELELGNEAHCLEVLVMAAGAQRSKLAECAEPGYKPGRPPAFALLKARQHYATSFSESPSHLVLASLFSYVMDGVETVRDKLLELIDTLPKEHPRAEEILQLLVKLLHLHCSRHSSPAALARDVLERAIDAFPNNTIFLSLYLWCEAQYRIHGRVHRLVSRLTTDSPDQGVAGLLWAVWAEAMGSSRTFWDVGGGGAERVRRALDRGINSALGRHSAALWMLYIEFEALMGKPAAAKALVYRAIAAVGGCKELYMLAFSPQLRSHFMSRELRAMAELMAERGIRMRVGVEAYWEDVDTEAEEEEEEEEFDAGEYEYAMLRDREELKPY